MFIPIRAIGVLALGCMLSACGLMHRDARIAAGVAVAAATVTPTTDIEQVYYLGVFDPQDQLPPTLYRIRVRGQASSLNFTRYASGWVHANVIDSLSSSATFNMKEATGGAITKTEDDAFRSALNGRRLVMFGPEGFREAPKDHRLVIVMGSSPDKFFGAIDEALGTVAAATQGVSAPGLDRGLLQELDRMHRERDRIDYLLRDVDAESGGAL